MGKMPITIVLIVPYGIETQNAMAENTKETSFNCTLWNWNIQEGAKGVFALKVLIVPYGIETDYKYEIGKEYDTF